MDQDVDGSCKLKQGLAEVMCLVEGPIQKQGNNDDLLKINYATFTNNSIEKRTIKHDKEMLEFLESIRKSFEGIICSSNYMKSQIKVTACILHSDGGTKSALINCMTLALIDAGISMKEFLLSCTLGELNGELIIDPDEEEQYELQN